MTEKTHFAAFDVDGTIWPLDFEHEWLRALVTQGIAPASAIERGESLLRDHAAGVFDAERYLAFFFSFLGGRSRGELERSVARVLEGTRGKLYHEARLAIDRWRDSGVPVVLLTSVLSVAAERIAGELGIDLVLATELEFDDAQVFTGRIVPPYCYGPGKVDKAFELCQEKGWRLSDGAYYADSPSDAPMLDAVGKAVVINPAPELETLATARGWAVENWRRLEEDG